MIPDFTSSGRLPPGEPYQATWQELWDRFGWNEHRRQLLAGLLLAMQNLHDMGCRTVYVDGSFVTTKEFPNDFDACWDEGGVNFDDLPLLYPELLDFSNRRAAQRAIYGGELFMANAIAEVVYRRRFIDFFQLDPEFNSLKGIVAVSLETLP